MPIYEYNCTKCKKHFEVMQKITEKPEANCPDCGTPSKRVMSQTSFSLKGGGWYKDGYSSSGQSGTKKSTTPSKDKK